MVDKENCAVTVKQAFQDMLSEEKNGASAFGLTYFSMSVSAIMVKYIDYVVNAKKKERAVCEDYIRFLSGDEMFEHIDMFRTMNRFFEWLLKEKTMDGADGDLSRWYDFSFICGKWDEYVSLLRE